jgi:hypothetical protein
MWRLRWWLLDRRDRRVVRHGLRDGSLFKRPDGTIGFTADRERNAERDREARRDGWRRG